MFSRFIALSNEPRYFLEFLKLQNESLYSRVVSLITFEEVSPNTYRLQKLYKKDTWDHQTESSLDRLWWDYCNNNY